MMRYLCLVLLVVSVNPLWAALCGIAWPGWEVSTSEVSSSLKYPISNMLDGDPHTAWVFHKGWRDLPPGVSWGYSDKPDDVFNHGIDTNIYVEADRGNYFVCDGIGIINGYAKNGDIYRRNNRITRITLNCYGPGYQWRKSFTLRETLAMQRIPVPHLRLRDFFIKIEAVQTGKDDDLCISELKLYHGKKTIPWRLTNTVLSTPMRECDGDPYYTLVRGHKTITLNGNPKTSYRGFLQPRSPRVMLFAGQQLYLYDLHRGVSIWRRTFTGSGEQIGWQNGTQALFQARERNREYWYRFDATHLTWRRCTAPSKTRRNFLNNLIDNGC